MFRLKSSQYIFEYSDRLNMKSLTITTLLLIFTSQVWGTSSNPKQETFKNISFNNLQSARWEYVRFLMRVETQIINDKQTEFHSQYDGLKRLLYPIENIYSAYGATKDGDMCFFGGWPSKLQNNICKGPWSYKNDESVKAMGDTYNQDNTCGGNFFRCNPVLFGSPVEGAKSPINGVNVNLNPNNGNGKGYCVDASTGYKELTQKCEKASRDSIPNIINELKADSEDAKAKREQLVKLHNSIFGEDGKGGFCANFKSNSGEVYDACDDLKNRLTHLGVIAGDVANQVPTDPESTIEDRDAEDEQNQGPDHSHAMALMRACHEYLNKEETSDPLGRNLVGKLYGGLAACSLGQNEKALEPFEDFELERMATEFNKVGYLRDLNEKSLKNTIKAFMINELAFVEGNPEYKEFAQDFLMRGILRDDIPMHTGDQFFVNEKTKFFEKLKKKFPDLSDENYKKVFVDAYDEISKDKDQIEQQNFETMGDNFQKASQVINNACHDLHKRFQKKFGDEVWFTGNYFREKSKDETDWLKFERNNFKNTINQSLNEYKTTPFLSSETFREEVLDPTADNFETCLDEPAARIMNPKVDKKTFYYGVLELRENLLNGLDDINDGSIWGFGNDWLVNNKVDEYIKTAPISVLRTIMEKDGEEQEKLAKFLCGRIKSIQTWDDYKTIGNTSIGYGTAAAGVACVFGPAKGRACQLMIAGSTTSAVAGFSMEQMALGDNKTNLNELAKGGVSVTDSGEIEQKNNDRAFTGKTQVVTGALGTFATGINMLRAGNPAVQGTGLMTTTGRGLGPVYQNVDDAAAQGQKLLTTTAQTGGRQTGSVSNSLDDVTFIVDSKGVVQIGTAAKGSVINPKNLNISASNPISIERPYWEMYKQALLSGKEAAKNLPKISEIRFFDSAGKISLAGRDLFKHLHNLKSMPSSKISDPFIQNAKKVLITNKDKTGKFHLNARNKMRERVQATLKDVLGIEGQLTKANLQTASQNLTSKFKISDYPTHSQAYKVARDELERVKDFIKLIIDQVPAK